MGKAAEVMAVATVVVVRVAAAMAAGVREAERMEVGTKGAAVRGVAAREAGAKILKARAAEASMVKREEERSVAAWDGVARAMGVTGEARAAAGRVMADILRVGSEVVGRAVVLARVATMEMVAVTNVVEIQVRGAMVAAIVQLATRVVIPKTTGAEEGIEATEAKNVAVAKVERVAAAGW